MLIDFHTHIFPKEMRANREKYFKGESGFQMLYASEKAKLIGGEEMLRVMDDEGVDLSVVFGFPWKNSDYARQHNDYVMEQVARHPRRFKGLCCFDTCHEGAAKEVERCIDGGLSGVGELAFYETGIVCEIRDSLEPIMAVCRENDLPVMIHTNEPVGHMYPGKSANTLAQIYDILKRFPHNKIVLAHWGGGIFFYGLLKKEVKAVLKNVWVDTAASPFLYDPAIYRYAIDIFGLEKILFGSDYPLIKPARYIQELSSSGLTHEEIDAICGHNAQALVDFRQ
jgi:predicted TIM-barrel fold metal-dependent hydrolase